MTDTDRRSATQTVTQTIAATFVLGMEASAGDLGAEEYAVAVQRLERALRPWDVVHEMGPRVVGVHCTALTNAREVDAIAGRLADVVRAPMAVGDDIRTLGVCVGSAVVTAGESAAASLARARAAMEAMRTARSGLLAPDLPGQRGDIRLPH